MAGGFCAVAAGLLQLPAAATLPVILLGILAIACTDALTAHPDSPLRMRVVLLAGLAGSSAAIVAIAGAAAIPATALLAGSVAVLAFDWSHPAAPALGRSRLHH